MKNQWLERESKRWEDQEIISSKQREEILDLYPTKKNTSVFFTFALILLSLALLTFLAFYWTAIHPLIRTTILLIALTSFYYLGTKWVLSGKKLIGDVSFIIALFIFGISIFLIGEMYHFNFNSILVFLVWGVIALLLYFSYPSRRVWLAGVVILLVGQMYDLIGLRDFSWLLFALLIMGFGPIIAIRPVRWMAWIFGLVYVVQITGLSIERLSIYWASLFLILFYFFGKLLNISMVSRVFGQVAQGSMFLLVVFHVLFMDSRLNVQNETDILFFFLFVFFISLIILYLYSRKEVYSLFQLVIFIPLFAVPDIGEYLASAALFIFSISLLLEGFNHEIYRTMNIGTAAFLISTFVIYTQVAWGYLSQSLFFLIAAIILSSIGFLLNWQQKRYAGREENWPNDT